MSLKQEPVGVRHNILPRPRVQK